MLPEKSAGHAREPKTADAGELVLLEPGFFISMSIFGGSSDEVKDMTCLRVKSVSSCTSKIRGGGC